ncbi:hypothetical protein Xmau_04489 [Xenorhabdus mauleonii]|uniref:Uncharacterized protein n=1 Tax=Xenorhabdus mauleonii TaxID=351675 RepID=A0A1I3YE02_9GAMM|nr:hypothetical protein [Xenorhabdus mauleonii]PHM35608.1 hypothetical protein Xmau_04489 [Xenorhabdus mauleonii]SFK29599.1 hypothetical protein SAMN05421680_1502 [Xenorhabdus mauleonii]
MNTIEHICNELGLPKGDSFIQDWVLELPEEYRTKEWLKKYIVAYSSDNYSELEKNTLMELMLDIANDFLTQNVNCDDESIPNVLNLLSNNYQYHLQLIDYWSLDEELLEDCFTLTPKVREIKNKLGLA